MSWPASLTFLWSFPNHWKLDIEDPAFMSSIKVEKKEKRSAGRLPFIGQRRLSSNLEMAMAMIRDRWSWDQKAKQEQEKEWAKVTIKNEVGADSERD